MKARPESVNEPKQTKRMRGMGRIYPQRYPHADGSESTVWWIAYYVNGKQYRESSKDYGGRESDAVRLLKKRIGESGKGRPIGPSVERTTFADLKQMILDDYARMERRSVKGVLEPALAHLEDFFGRMRIVNLTPDVLDRYVALRVEQGAKAGTVKRDVRVLRRMFALGLRAGKVAMIPPMPTFADSAPRKGFCSPEQIERVIAALPDYLKPVVRALYVTGWRKREVTSLEWSRVDFDEGVIRLGREDTKTGEARAFPFAAIPALLDLFQTQRDRTRRAERERGAIIPWCFWRGKERARPVGSFGKRWEKATKAGGVPGLLVHDLRRSAARNLVRAGNSETVAMAMLGHRTPSVFRRYNITSSQDLIDGAARLGEYLAAQAENPQETRRIGPTSEEERARHATEVRIESRSYKNTGR
jgi:integrase